MENLQIENLNQLIDALHACSLGIFSFGDVATAAQVNMQDTAYLEQWNPDHYSRISIEKTDDFELLLLCWEPGQKSEIHNHNGQEGWMKILQGSLTEELYDVASDAATIALASKRTITPDHTYHISDKQGVHRIINNTNERSISLHLYVRPVETVSVYDETTGMEKQVSLKTD